MKNPQESAGKQEQSPDIIGGQKWQKRIDDEYSEFQKKKKIVTVSTDRRLKAEDVRQDLTSIVRVCEACSSNKHQKI